MGCCSKTFSYISGILHLLLNILGTVITITVCVWYKSEDQKEFNKKYGIMDTPFWLLVVLAISWGFSIFSTISLLRGIRTERHRLFHSFFSGMSNIILFIIIRAIIVLVRHIKANKPSGDVALNFCCDMLFPIISGLLMIPLFILYKQLAGESYFSYCLSYCMCWNPKHKPTRVPNTQV